jgi:hypothetical protein
LHVLATGKNLVKRRALPACHRAVTVYRVTCFALYASVITEH